MGVELSDSGTPSAGPGRRAPRGKEAVVRALVQSGMELFAERGPSAVSVRDVAARARVNHALVFRHFGSKQGLVRAVWARTVQDLARSISLDEVDVASLVEMTERVATDERVWRLMARAALDREGLELFAAEMPFLEKLVASIRASQLRGHVRTPVDARLLVAMMGALGLGWLVFEPMLVATLKLPPGPPSEQRRRVRNAFLRLAQWVPHELRDEATDSGS